jgi:hypothetical protein
MIKITNKDWREAEWPETVDVLLTDPPYSARTKKGQRTGSSIDQSTIQYDHMTQEGAEEIAAFWSKRVRWWAIIFGDHIAFQWHEAAWKRAGWYVFAPIGYVKKHPPPRMRGDGPTTSVEHIMVARPRRKLPPSRSGSRPGHYMARRVRSIGVAGMKNLKTMTDILDDYCLGGDIIADPFSGAGTTLLATMLVTPKLPVELSRIINGEIGETFAYGSEIDPKSYQIAKERLGTE